MLGGLVTHIATGRWAWIIAVGLAIVVVASIEGLRMTLNDHTND